MKLGICDDETNGGIENEVTSVRIVNGNNGNMLDLSEEEISDLTNRCRVIDCKRIINKEPGSGWSYSIDFSYGNTSKSIVLVSSELCEIDNVYYRMEEKDGEDVINIIKKFYEENKAKEQLMAALKAKN